MEGGNTVHVPPNTDMTLAWYANAIHYAFRVNVHASGIFPLSQEKSHVMRGAQILCKPFLAIYLYLYSIFQLTVIYLHLGSFTARTSKLQLEQTSRDRF